MGKQYDEAKDRLKAFAEKDETDLNEGTASYYKFDKPGTSFNGLFQGTEMKNLDSANPDKITECVAFLDENNERFIFAQTVIVKEVKKKWDELGEIGFPVRIIYKGVVGSGQDQYQSFRLLFE